MAKFEIAGYEMYEILGRGGMAVVYRALHLNLDRAVAIKVMDTALNSDETFSERFIREARISARLVHPHILQIYDVNSFDTLNYISMELLEGGDLSHFIRGSMEQRTIYDVVEQMCEALDYAAAQGYVHRDIKPSNIMLRAQDEYVLADFGIAKAANSGTQMTQTGLMVGTPSYMSPEQAKGIEVDGRSDLYSLAIVAYEMLTKTLPYDSDSAVSTAVKHLTEDIPTLPENLSAYQPFIDKAMAKSPEDRYQSGREMFQAFCEVRGEFPDDAVLTVGKASATRKKTGSGEISDAGVSNAWDDSTQVAIPSRPSRPYKLADTGQREPLVSGIRSDQRPAERKASTGGSTVFRAFAGIVLLGGLAFGGYTYWQGQQTASTKDIRAVTAELSEAYGALNNEQLEKAAIAFRKVLSIDSGHAAARQGMSDVDVSFVAAIEGALGSGDLKTAKTLFSDYGLFFADSGSFQRLELAIEQFAQEQNLESVQSDRITILVAKANKAVAKAKLFEPKSDNAYLYIQQALALDANSNLAGDALTRLLTAALDRVYLHISDFEFGEARDLLNQLRSVDPGLSSLAEAQRTVDRAEKTELERQTRWANFSDEKRQSILEQLALAEDLLAKGIYTSAEERVDGRNAYDSFMQVLELDPENVSANRSSQRIARIYLAQMEEAVSKGQFEAAEIALSSAQAVAPDYPAVQEKRQSLLVSRENYARQSEFKARVDAVLARANSEFERVAEDSSHAGKAANLYREALELDLENEAAQEGLTQVTQFYITSANEAMAYGEFKAAEAALDRAQGLAPGREDIVALLADLSAKEAAWVTGQNVAMLIETGEKQFTERNYMLAAENFSTALKMEPANSEATNSLDEAVDALLVRARAGIKKGDFSTVGTDLADAAVIAPGRKDVAELQAQLPALERAWNASDRVEQSLANARAFYNKGYFSKAAASYREVLALKPGSRAASEGFDKAIAGLVSYAKSEAGKGDFATARKSLGSAQKLAPGNTAAERLLADLPRIEQDWQAQQEALIRQSLMVQGLANTAMDALQSGDLDKAGQAYDKLAQNHAEMEATRRLKRELLSAYIAATREEINNKQFDTAEEYLIRGQVLAPDYAAWRELEDELAVSRTSSRRRLGAY